MELMQPWQDHVFLTPQIDMTVNGGFGYCSDGEAAVSQMVKDGERCEGWWAFLVGCVGVAGQASPEARQVL